MGRLVTRRISRRMLLTDFGAAGLGVAILGACSSDDGSSADTQAPGTDPATTDPAATDPPATDAPAATEPNATDPPATEPADPTDVSTGLQLQHVSFGFVSAYVLLRGNEAAVVDTGIPGEVDLIADGLSALGASFTDVRHVVITHKHDDHQGGLGEVLAEATGAMVYAGEADLAEITSSVPLTAIGDGDEVLGMGVLNTPGHTPGSISLFDTETGILVAGDAVNGDEAGGLTGANPRFSDDMTAAGASIARLAELPSTVVAFGHGGAPVDDAMAKLAALTTG
ncbi:MAG: MBL fold metallo-hydrolase [Ilumatobacteraceae bacterium]